MIKFFCLGALNAYTYTMDLILKLKKQDKDTSLLEHQIDVMVYHLYDLTYDEAKVIDENLSSTDFEKYKL
jgi:hypothetical protein